MIVDRRFGPYRVTRELGSGTLLTVYQAIHEPLGRKVAIKALKPAIAPTSSFAAQLEREARVLAELSHPNVVALFDFVKNDSEMYVVMEYLRGFSLSEVLGRKPRLRTEIVAAIGIEVARALAHAHERGIIHRDVKPANVVLLRTGGVKLIDFGIAQRERLPTADEPLAERAHEAFGTPAYMAPEQILGDIVDARTDVFSLGVVLYQLCCGARPFDRDDGKDGSLRSRREPASPLRQRAPAVPRALERIIMRALERLPSDRWPTANAVQTELEAFLREREAPATAELVKSALVAAGLVSAAPTREEATGSVRLRRDPWYARAWSFFPLTLLVVLGGAVAQLSPSAHDPGPVEGPLALPAHLPHGDLRVLATPWAEVAVDGQHVGTTPMGRAIALAPGVHFVTFTHPSAAVVTRKIDIAEGGSVVVDVTMDVTGAGKEEDDGGTK
jgi:serine/threonine-protein kinase